MILSADKCYYLNIGFNEPFLDFSLTDFATENITKEKIIGGSNW